MAFVEQKSKRYRRLQHNINSFTVLKTTTEPPVSDHPKFPGYAVPYGRWPLTNKCIRKSKTLYLKSVMIDKPIVIPKEQTLSPHKACEDCHYPFDTSSKVGLY